METAMETESTADDGTATNSWTVSGKFIALAGGFGFISFEAESVGKGNLNCYFRGHRIFEEGKKIKPSEVKSHGRLKEVFEKRLKNMKVTAVVTALKETAVFTTNEGAKLSADFYSHCVWLDGVVPPEDEHLPKPRTGEQKAGEDSVKEELMETAPPAVPTATLGQLTEAQQTDGTLRCKEGILIYRSLPGKGFIAFDLGGTQEYATFDFSLLFVDGRPLERSQRSSWPRLKKEVVKFNAAKFKHPFQFAMVTNGDDGSQVNLKFHSNWSCSLVWIGSEPTPAAVADASSTEEEEAKESVENANFGEMMKNYEYATGKVVQLLDKNTGVLALQKAPSNIRNVIFKMQDLSENGVKVKAERLSSVIQIGVTLSCFCKPLIPSKLVGDRAVTLTAVQVWKGTREAKSAGKAKTGGGRRLPAPSEATHPNRSGRVVLLEGNMGLAHLDSSEAAGRVLFFKGRHQTKDGQRCTASFFDALSLGDSLNFDLVEADQNEAHGEYEWVSVLSWTGATKPTLPNPQLKGKDTMTSFRGRLIMLDTAGNLGSNSGLIQITGGPDQAKMNHKIYFSSEQTFIFGVCMAKADLKQILQDNEKVQLELGSTADPASEQTRSLLSQTYNTDVHGVASCVWIGSPPKPDEEYETSNKPLRKEIHTWLEKRGMEEVFFRRLFKGEIAPKSEEFGPRNTQVPPTITYVKPLELKKPKGKGQPVVAGVAAIENGPFRGRQGAFTRDGVWIFGHHVAKSDLMRVVRNSDRYEAKILETNPTMLTLTSMHLGGIRASPAAPTEPDFQAWLTKHGMQFNDFMKFIQGDSSPSPFFPLPLETQNGRVIHLYEPSWPQGPAEYGIVKIHQGSLAKKDILFHRSSVYIWNVACGKADLSHIIKKGERVFVEVSTLTRKDRLELQGNLKMQGLPKFLATLVYIGGGRPKAPPFPAGDHRLCALPELGSNSNLVQWLEKRNLPLGAFQKMITGVPAPLVNQSLQSSPMEMEAPPLVRSEQRFMPNAPPPSRFPNNQGPGSWPGGPGVGPMGRGMMEPGFRPPGPGGIMPPRGGPPVGMRPRAPMDLTPPRGAAPIGVRPRGIGEFETPRPVPAPPPPRVSPGPANPLSSAENPILASARELAARVMKCDTPDDEAAKDVIRSGSELNLAEFMVATLQNAISQFKETSRRLPFPEDFDRPRDLMNSREGSIGAIGEERRMMREMQEFRPRQRTTDSNPASSDRLYGLAHQLLNTGSGMPTSSIAAERSPNPEVNRRFGQSWYSNFPQDEPHQQQRMATRRPSGSSSGATSPSVMAVGEPPSKLYRRKNDGMPMTGSNMPLAGSSSSSAWETFS